MGPDARCDVVGQQRARLSERHPYLASLQWRLLALQRHRPTAHGWRLSDLKQKLAGRIPAGLLALRTLRCRVQNFNAE
jgi:hypothetical protein